ncbi:DNA-directed RNA polymerase subunit alpha C-terminal domain-containing protein [Candidatus Protochlamydia phocaeensis]|uniref:DNA-directed RNA polymerase subunit alpha C-terminal domain-containing protein n=1 Tax=Candidatus Protochlamydia phocaeensis TaxID=1414722 RepID=UPI0008381889|nr:DNA-directed RNA polymerase subunit alpha C-terminal domain-containing protein [Candidatus Protochlamydia phocaeensis]
MNASSDYTNLYSRAYTHPGLCDIYKIETIDLSTIRRLNITESVGPAVKNPSSPLKPHHDCWKEPDQLAFNFLGQPSKAQSWVLDEPIQLLELPPQAEKALGEQDKCKLRDLMNLRQQDYIFLKGLGQGHIDEVKSKLENYLNSHYWNESSKINVLSLLRVLLGALNRKAVYLLMDQFGLAEFFPLSTAETLEIRHLPKETQAKMISQIQQELNSPLSKTFAQEALTEIAEALIKPWMKKREGLATSTELNEKLTRLCAGEETWINKIFLFLSHVYLGNKSFFDACLVEAAPQLYCISKEQAYHYRQVVEKADSYFYHPSITYSLEELAYYLYREFALKWDEKPLSFIYRVLEKSPSFSVFQKNVELRIRLY